MRFVLAATVLSLLPLSAMAQSQPAAGLAAGGGITREQFIQRAAEAAGRRFDSIDTNHTGVITRAQFQAWRQEHPGPAGVQQQIPQQ